MDYVPVMVVMDMDIQLKVRTMPSKSYRQCHAIGCHKLTKDKYCPSHVIEEDKQRKEIHKYYKENRTDTKEQAFYVSKEWRKLRAYKLQQSPLCEICLPLGKVTPGDEIDHIIEVKDAWHLRLTLSNLQTLCAACHRRKTREEAKKRQGNR
jgi:5-methylcytosine-specific restriction protein A